jgi:S1-C subfamily serine protease
MRAALAILLAVVAPVVGACGGGDDDDSPPAGANDRGRSETTRVEVIESSPQEGGLDPRAIYKSDAPGVVTVISLFGSDGNSLLGNQGEGVGTGFVLSGEGEIATNAHVVSTGEGQASTRASEVYVEFADGNKVEADIVGTDPHADIALLKVDPESLSLRPLPLGESDSVEVGEPVAAIGSPFNEPQSLSVGVISAVDRTIGSLTQFGISEAFQTDAAINPGNSGGPLVDAAGRVIGVNQQIKSRSGGGEGVGFAVPVDAVKRSIDKLRRDGEARYAYLGVESVDLYPQLVERFDLGVDEGAWLQDVTPGGPADQGGLRGGGGGTITFQAEPYTVGGDVITKVGDLPVANPADLAEAIADSEPGDEVMVVVNRDGKTQELKVRLGERPISNPSG